MIWPMPPQCWVLAPMRAAGLPSRSTFGSPSSMVNVFDPQQAAAIPVSPFRATGLLLIRTFGLPDMIGPMALCGQACDAVMMATGRSAWHCQQVSLMIEYGDMGS